MTPVHIRAAVLDAIVRHARRDVPRECCGLLLGSTSLIDDAVEARNIRESETRYEVDPADHFRAIRLARQSGRAVRGAYHSHPRGPAQPSATDLAEARDSTLLYVIVSLEAGTAVVRAFRLDGGNFNEMELVPQA
jgi:proteasome lid subunit RPN8/RPN11